MLHLIFLYCYDNHRSVGANYYFKNDTKSGVICFLDDDDEGLRLVCIFCCSIWSVCRVSQECIVGMLKKLTDTKKATWRRGGNLFGRVPYAVFSVVVLEITLDGTGMTTSFHHQWQRIVKRCSSRFFFMFIYFFYSMIFLLAFIFLLPWNTIRSVGLSWSMTSMLFDSFHAKNWFSPQLILHKPEQMYAKSSQAHSIITRSSSICALVYFTTRFYIIFSSSLCFSSLSLSTALLTWMVNDHHIFTTTTISSSAILQPSLYRLER